VRVWTQQLILNIKELSQSSQNDNDVVSCGATARVASWVVGDDLVPLAARITSDERCTTLCDVRDVPLLVVHCVKGRIDGAVAGR